MSLAVVRSPGRHGATTPIANVYYKCDDCGDVSHSQASLNLHRSVCHNPEGSKRPSTDDQEEAEKNSEVVDKTEQIAESCECPKCGEQLLLLRERTYNCALCDFQDTDQSKFFVHLKQHYEQNATYNLEAGSVIFEQVIDSTEDLDALKVSEVVEERIERSDSEEVEPDDGEEVDDSKDPLYAPDDDDLDDDDVESVETEECKLEKGNVELSWTQPLKKVGADKNLMKAPVAKPKDSSNSKYKFGISWNSSGDGASKKITFVKTSQLVSSVDETKPLLKSASTTKQLSFVKSPTAGGRPATVWKESASGKETPKKHTSPGGMRWVRLEDIKLESPSESFPRPLPSDFPKYSSILKKPTPSNRSTPVKRSNTTKEPIPVKVEKESNQNSEAEPKKKTKKPTEKKPPRERQLPVCGVCKRIFSTAQSLKVHMRIHTGEKNFTCDQCGKAFTQWSTCSQHIEALHSGIKRHTCEFCGKSFARSSSLKVHRRIHTGEKVYYCNVCGKGFRCKSYMDRHRTFHTGEKRYRCEFCSKNFRTSTDMKRHRNAIHFGLGNVSLTVAKELLVNRMDIMRTPQRQATVQRLPEQFAESVDTSDSEEVIRATSIITDSTYEL